MRINKFSDGSIEKALRFTANGSQKVYIRIPRDAIVKRATVQIEGKDLFDTKVVRVGVVKNCPLPDFTALEEKLEATSRRRSTTKPGWGAGLTTEFVVSEKDNYQVIPVDPTLMIGAQPSYFRREFDILFIPEGKLDADLSAVLNSGVPVVTTNFAVAHKLGITAEQTLRAGVQTLRVTDAEHYVTTGLENILQISDTPNLLINAVASYPNTNTLIDTGIPNQAVVLTSITNKYAYLGFTDLKSTVENPNLFEIFKKTLEWTAIGGTPTNVMIEIDDEPIEWRYPGALSGITEVTDFAPQIVSYMRRRKPVGNYYELPITIKTTSPGVIVLSNLKIYATFLKTIRTFSDGSVEKTLFFDSVEPKIVYVKIPSYARVLDATLKLSGSFSKERIALKCSDTTANYGVLSGGEFMLAQKIIPSSNINVTRIAVHISKLDVAAIVDVELREDLNDSPHTEVIATAELESDSIPTKYDWVDVNFENLILTARKPYWLVIKTRQGRINWHADTNAPLGGLLKYSKDNGKSWLPHKMDALFILYNTLETQTPSPTFVPAQRDVHWSFSGEFSGLYNVPDFSAQLNQYLQQADKTAEYCEVPLVYTSESIGELLLTDLEIKCELEEPEEEPQAQVAETLEGILELVEKLRASIIALSNEVDERLAKKYKLRAQQG